MSNHTKGPWGLRITETGPWSVFNADGNWIAVTTRKQWKDEDRANARLIAAAPDLLEALEAAVECGMVPRSSAKDGGATRHVWQVIVADQIRAAIAKAKGKA